MPPVLVLNSFEAFSGGVIVLSACGTIAVGAISLLTVNLIWLRFILAVFGLGGFLFFAEKKMGIITAIIRMIRKR